ncbi:MAG: VOC family protein [Caulobacterales bacterium]|nr:VOC family protein [Caulobacterales bacterium]
MISAVHHASITTGDLDRLVRFYRDLLGFQLVMESSWEAGNQAADAIYGLTDTSVRMAMLRMPNGFLELFEFRHPVGKAGDPNRPVCDQGLTHICLAVTGIQAEYERLLAAGVRFHCPPQHAPGLCTATYARDPDGNIVELMEPEPGGLFSL